MSSNRTNSNLVRKGPRSSRPRQATLAFEPLQSGTNIVQVNSESGSVGTGIGPLRSPARVTYKALTDLSSPVQQLRIGLGGSSPLSGGARVGSSPARSQKKDGKLRFKPLTPEERGAQREREMVDAALRASTKGPSDSDSDDLILLSAAKRRRLNNKTMNSSSGDGTGFMSRHRRAGTLGQDGADDSHDAAPTSTRTLKRKAITIESDSEDSNNSTRDAQFSSPPKAHVNKRGRATIPKEKTTPRRTPISQATKSLISGGSGDLSHRKAAASKRTVNGSVNRQKALVDVSTDSGSDVDELSLPTPKYTQPASTATGDAAAQTDEEDDVNDDDIFAPTARSSQRRSGLPTVAAEDSDIPSYSRGNPLPVAPLSLEHIRDDEDDEDDIVSPHVKSSQRQSARVQIVDDEESDSLPEAAKIPKAIGKGKGREASRETSTPGRITRQRQVKRHRTAKEKTMELLRRRRAGQKVTELTPSGSEEDEPHQGIYDSNSEVEVLSQFDDEEAENDQNMEQIRQSIRSINNGEYDDDFVVEDDDAPIGAPGYGLHDIPHEFTLNAHKPLKDHFKDSIEWLVQRKINPGFASEDPIYVQAFRKMDDEVRGLATSKFTSSAWKEDFTRALWARPELLQNEVAAGDAFTHMHCDACNRNHPTKFIVQFGGKAYNKESLEDIDPDSEASDASDSDSADVDEQGRRIPPLEKTWHVGRFCAANAETAHSLIHWKHALNSWVMDELANSGHLKARRLKERDGWSKKKRSDYANEIVDGWEKGNQLKGLWRDFKANLEAARNASQTRTKTSRQ